MALYDLTKSLVKDSSGKLIDPTDYTNAVTAALKHYSTYRRRLVCLDSPGNNTFDIPLPLDWDAGFSAMESIEYPAGNIPETLIDSRDWRLYQAPTGIVIRFALIKTAIGKNARLLYTKLHNEASLPPADMEAVANLAASLCCRLLANAFGNTGDPIIQADVVNYRSKGDEYARRAKELDGLYKNHLGIRDNDTAPASVVMVSKPDNPRVRLTHVRSR
jgi:hypothetical protein